MGGYRCKFETMKAFCLIESSVKASWFHTSGRYLAGTWLHSDNRFACMHGSNCTWTWSGETDRSSQSHESQLRTSSQRRIEMKFFIATFSTVQVGAFLYSTCKRQARRTPSTPAIRCGDQARVESATKPALFFSSYFDPNPRGLKLNCTYIGHRSRHELGCSCFPKPHVFLSIFFRSRSQQAARGRPQISIMRDRRHGNWSSSCLEVLRPVS